VRGFWVNTDRNYSYLGVLGFARPGDYNTRILLLINGHRLNDNIYDQALIGTEFPLDVDLIERIEIVRGPSSSLYGTDAFFGVVNVITQSPPMTPGVEVSTDAASQFARKARVTVGVPELLDGALFSASMYRSDGNDRLYFPEFNSPDTNNGVAQGVDGDRAAQAFAQVHWKNFQLEGLLGSREKLIPTASFGTVFDSPAERTTDSRGYGELRYQRDFASGMQLMSRGFYDAYSYRGIYPYGSDGMEYDSARGDWVGAEVNVSRPVGHRNTVTAGGELRYNLKQDQWTYLQGWLLNSNQTSTILGFYGQDEFKVASRLTVNAGLRLDHFTTFGTALSPRAAAILRLDRKSILKYAYGHAFRAPNVYELYYGDGVTQEGNPALKPETIDSQSLAYQRELSPSFQVVVEAFYNSLNQLLDQQVDPNNGLYQYVNITSDRGKGLELELDAQHHGLRGELSYTVQRTVDQQTQAMLANSPMHLAKMKLQVPVPGALLASAEMDYEGPQTSYTGVHIPNLLNTNVTLSTRKPLLGFDLSASCYNLFDRNNYDPPPPALVQNRLLLDGRTARVQIARRFPRE
jgi:outer membrane receptor for ferrienterochelin and colicins